MCDVRTVIGGGGIINVQESVYSTAREFHIVLGLLGLWSFTTTGSSDPAFGARNSVNQHLNRIERR